MDVAVLRASDDLQSGLTILATIGSIAPLLGCLNRLGHHECLHRNCSAAKHKPCGCGPGIAEALLATGLGLLAAIPAVIFITNLAVIVIALLRV